MHTPVAALAIPDVIVLGVCVLLGVRGAVKGFVWQAIRTIGLITALWGATQLYKPFGGWIVARDVPFVPEAVAPVAAWVSVAVGVILLFGFFAYMGRGLMKSVELSGVDRFLGLALGGVMGLVLCVAGFVVWGKMWGEDNLCETLEGATSARFMAKTVDLLKPVFPPIVHDEFGNCLAAIERSADPDRDPKPASGPSAVEKPGVGSPGVESPGVESPAVEDPGGGVPGAEKPAIQKRVPASPSD